MNLWKMSYDNIVQEGENAGCQHFLLFPQCFFQLFFRDEFHHFISGQELFSISTSLNS